MVLESTKIFNDLVLKYCDCSVRDLLAEIALTVDKFWDESPNKKQLEDKISEILRVLLERDAIRVRHHTHNQDVLVQQYNQIKNLKSKIKRMKK